MKTTLAIFLSMNSSGIGLPDILLNPVFAYIDPGTGSLIIQALIAVFLGASFTVKIYWKKILFFLRSLFPGKSQQTLNNE